MEKLYHESKPQTINNPAIILDKKGFQGISLDSIRAEFTESIESPRKTEHAQVLDEILESLEVVDFCKKASLEAGRKFTSKTSVGSHS